MNEGVNEMKERKSPRDLKTTDIYLAAYLLQANIQTKEIISEGRIHKKVMFIFPNTTQLTEHIQKFQQNQAIVKVRDYSYFVERAKDLMYTKMREVTGQ